MAGTRHHQKCVGCTNSPVGKWRVGDEVVAELTAAPELQHTNSGSQASFKLRFAETQRWQGECLPRESEAVAVQRHAAQSGTVFRQTVDALPGRADHPGATIPAGVGRGLRAGKRDDSGLAGDFWFFERSLPALCRYFNNGIATAVSLRFLLDGPGTGNLLGLGDGTDESTKKHPSTASRSAPRP